MDIEVGKRLKEIRSYFHISQKDFATKYGISQQALSRYEMGKSYISDEIKKSLAKEFGININWLLTGEGKMFLKEEKTVSDNQPSKIKHKLSYEEMLPILNEIGSLNIFQKERLADFIKKIKE